MRINGRMRLCSGIALGIFAYSRGASADPTVESPSTIADEANACVAEDKAMNDVQDRYKPLLDAAEQRSKDLEKESDDTKLLEVALQWHEEKWSFDLPTVNMVTKKMSLDLPQFAMKTKKMSFDVVETYTGTTTCGKYPEFKCHGLSCSVHWSDIKCDLPQVRKKRVEFSMDIPETKWDRTSFSMDIPEVTMARQEWKFKVPSKIKVDTILDKQKELEGKGQKLKAETELIVQAMQKDVGEKAYAVVQCHRSDLVAKQSAVAADFDKAIAQMNAGIQAIVAQGGDPHAVKSEQGTPIDLYAAREGLTKKRQETLDNFSKALESLDKAGKEGLKFPQSPTA